MRRRAIRSLVALAGVASALAACSGGPATPAPAQGQLVISTSSRAGVYYAYGRSLAAQLKVTEPDLDVTVETSSGSVSNLRRLTLGIADLGLATVDTTEQRADECLTANALDAADERRVPLAALGRIYDDYLQIVVPADSPVDSVPDLAGRPVAVGGTGSGTALVACRVLSAARVRVDEKAVDVEPGMQALAQGAVDAVFWSGALPTRPIADTAARLRIRLVPLGALADTMRTRYGAAYRPATIPPGPYGGPDQVATLASANLLIARADADPSMVNSVLTTIFARRDQIAAAVPATIATDRRTAILTGGLPLHPAAVEFYRRTKP
jgi:TRAP transporter TAXI family solute receptor